jgi:YjbE family integral membrane protein
MFSEIFTASAMSALFQVIMIDLVLAGDNAIIIGLAAAGLPREQRAKVIFIGIAAATLLRIGLALITTQLLGVVGLLLAGGLLLLWVSWKMWRELQSGNLAAEAMAADALEGEPSDGGTPRKTLREAVWQIIVADFSMSLDNVLAVGGAAREHPWVLIFGLALSIALMALAASWIARLLQRYHWIAYVGLAIIVYVAAEMIWRGWQQVAPFVPVSSTTAITTVVALAIAGGGVLAYSMRRKRAAD